MELVKVRRSQPRRCQRFAAGVPANSSQRGREGRGEANFAPFVTQMLVASGRFRVSADSPDQVALFQGVARRLSDVLKLPVVSSANGSEIVVTFGQEAPALALRSPDWSFLGGCAASTKPGRTLPISIAAKVLFDRYGNELRMYTFPPFWTDVS
jgi:hypothetical protein